MLSDLVWIKTYPDEAAAARVRELLKSRGIESVVTEDPGQAMRHLPEPIRGVRLGVRADDVRPALEILWNEVSQ